MTENFVFEECLNHTFNFNKGDLLENYNSMLKDKFMITLYAWNYYSYKKYSKEALEENGTPQFLWDLLMKPVENSGMFYTFTPNKPKYYDMVYYPNYSTLTKCDNSDILTDKEKREIELGTVIKKTVTRNNELDKNITLYLNRVKADIIKTGKTNIYFYIISDKPINTISDIDLLPLKSISGVDTLFDNIEDWFNYKYTELVITYNVDISNGATSALSNIEILSPLTVVEKKNRKIETDSLFDAINKLHNDDLTAADSIYEAVKD